MACYLKWLCSFGYNCLKKRLEYWILFFSLNCVCFQTFYYVLLEKPTPTVLEIVFSLNVNL